MSKRTQVTWTGLVFGGLFAFKLLFLSLSSVAHGAELSGPPSWWETRTYGIQNCRAGTDFAKCQSKGVSVGGYQSSPKASAPSNPGGGDNCGGDGDGGDGGDGGNTGGGDTGPGNSDNGHSHGHGNGNGHGGGQGPHGGK